MLVFGAGGMLGQDFLRAAKLANHEVEGLVRTDVDITDADAVERAVAFHAPDAVVNCAAFTNVDGAEDEAEEAMRVNADGARNVAAAAAKVGASVVYPSSDYVFDGSKDSPYVESDEPSPLSKYGSSKLAGEVDTSAVNPRHFIVRSSWLFGIGGRNFVETMIDLGTRTAPGAGGARPDRLPHLHRPPGRGPGAPHLHRRLRPAPHGRRRRMHLVRLRRGDLRAGARWSAR